MQHTTLPTWLCDWQGVRLRVEREALRKEKDPLSVARREEVDKELAALDDNLRPLLVRPWAGRGLGGGDGFLTRRPVHRAHPSPAMCSASPLAAPVRQPAPGLLGPPLAPPPQMRYQQEKERLDGIRRLQAKRQELQVTLAQAEARGDLARIADIRWAHWASQRRGMGCMRGCGCVRA